MTNHDGFREAPPAPERATEWTGSDRGMTRLSGLVTASIIAACLWAVFFWAVL